MNILLNLSPKNFLKTQSLCDTLIAVSLPLSNIPFDMWQLIGTDYYSVPMNI